ncbi:MAG: protein phosphatase 2C domain-containing protein [Candidatus Cohnella colombiensis]|uniref:Protein phosphatase 2C domain-containing protein n=1 Tax=Candidatus Cohnella colombiensis TaxID=3121368 RepID=A0AA95EUH8_9BACL|nr:MAG: protein phosphatase 2C domain-containing protein [Cohnella sp.]
MKFMTASSSEVGGRKVNEDCCKFIQLDQYGCWIIADGLGGHEGGQMASSLAVQRVIEAAGRKQLHSEAIMRYYIQEAHETLHAYQKQEMKLSRMRTTIVMLASDYRTASWAHVGDSRLYHFRGGTIFTETKDHSVCQSLVSMGEITRGQIRQHEDRSRLLRVLGAEGAVRPDVRAPVQVKPGDAFLLCSDGFWEYVTETEMEVDLSKSTTPEQWLNRMNDRLVRRAKPDHDNYSSIAIIVGT